MIPRRYLLVVWTFCLSVLLYVDRICVSAAKTEIAADLSLNDRQMGWVLSMFALGYALFQTPGGWLADRLGPRRALSLIDRSEAVPVQPVVRDPDEAIATLTLPSPEARKSALPASAMPTTPDTAMRSLDDARALLQRLTPSQTQTEVPPHEAP